MEKFYREIIGARPSNNIFDYNTFGGFTKLERMELTEKQKGLYCYSFLSRKKLEDWIEIKKLHKESKINEEPSQSQFVKWWPKKKYMRNPYRTKMSK